MYVNYFSGSHSEITTLESETVFIESQNAPFHSERCVYHENIDICDLYENQKLRQKQRKELCFNTTITTIVISAYVLILTIEFIYLYKVFNIQKF